MASGAIAHLIILFPTISRDMLDKLLALFISFEPIDYIGGNEGGCVAILSALRTMTFTHIWSINEVNILLPFIITKGLRDGNTQARIHSMECGINLINTLCSNNIENMTVINGIIDERMKDEPTHELEVKSLDYQREGLIVYIGAIARHMETNDERIISTLNTLFNALQTPSESVQRAVASCIAPLMKTEIVKGNVEKYVNTMLISLTSGGKLEYGHRRGAAYGLAGVVKGLGISSLKTYGIIDKIQEFATSKDRAESREGALLAVETLFDSLKRLFEPYILLLLPTLLQLFSDKSIEVRDAAQNTSRTLMSKLSNHGVKILMPKVLIGLENSKWRTKEAR